MEKVQKLPKEYPPHNPDNLLKKKQNKKPLADLLQIITIRGYRKKNARNIGKIKISHCYKCYFLTMFSVILLL